MTTKTDYSEQEWNLLLQAPVMAGTYIIAADPSVTAMAKEMKAMVTAIIAAPAPEEAQELVTAVAADIKARAEDKEKMPAVDTKDKEDPQLQIRNQLSEALAVLEEKAPDEKNGFCNWLMEVAQATAEAGKEGGFLGIGAVRVSDKEKAALDELRRLFGLNPAL